MKLPKWLEKITRIQVPSWTIWTAAGVLTVLLLFLVITTPQVSNALKELDNPRLTAFLLYLETGEVVPQQTAPSTLPPAPSTQPSTAPSAAPSTAPSSAPTEPSDQPTQPSTEPSSEPTEPSTEPTEPPLQLSHSDATLFYMGETFRISTGDVPSDQVMWWTEDGTIATVFNGQVTGVGRGTTYIFASYHEKTYVCVVRCRWDMLALVEKSITLTAAGASQTLTLDRKNLPGNVELHHLTWTSDDPSVATVADGVVTAVAPGTTVIRATLGDETVKCAVTCQWEVATEPTEPPTEPSVPPTEPTEPPTEPTQPSDPSDPSDPTDPTEPPAEPTEPPTEPTEPPTEPTEPPTEPTEPPTEPTEPPTEPTEPPTEPPAPSRPQFTSKDVYLVKYEKFNGFGKTPDIESALLAALNWDLDSGAPTVLIYHTHACESYIDVSSGDCRSTDPNKNMVKLGAMIAAKLEAAGIHVIHDTTLHDAADHDNAYAHSRLSVQDYLAQYPSIKFVIDLHRDAATYGNGYQWKTTCNVNGRTSAQLMIYVSGQHGAWRENLSVATKLHAQLERTYSGIMRTMKLAGGSHSYNQDLSNGALLIEVGFAGNTLGEAGVAVEALCDGIIALKNGAN